VIPSIIYNNNIVDWYGFALVWCELQINLRYEGTGDLPTWQLHMISPEFWASLIMMTPHVIFWLPNPNLARNSRIMRVVGDSWYET